MKAKRANPSICQSNSSNILKSLFETVQKEFKLENLCRHFPSESKIESSFVLFQVPNKVKLLTTLMLKETPAGLKIEMTTLLHQHLIITFGKESRLIGKTNYKSTVNPKLV